MKPLTSSITIFLHSSSRHLIRRTFVSHFSTSSLDSTSSSSSSSYHSSSRRNSDDHRNVRVSVWWDFENCQVPCTVNAFKVTQLITTAVRSVGIKGPVQITAFGDVFQLSRANQEALSSTGINLTHIPNGGKNSADRSLLVDLMYWVSQNPPPAHLFLISGDRDFASILHRLRMNNYNILLASTDSAPAVLCSAASIMWQWTSLVNGENLNGKYFNQPPDGPYASWYGHYRVPLEDPYTVCNHVSNRTSCMQSEEVSVSVTNLEFSGRPIPKTVVDVIRNILKSYPKGMSITELRAELGKSNVTIDKNFYGHKKFSSFLMAMPNLLKVQPQRDGQHIIRGVRSKTPETCLPTSNTASGPSLTTESTNDTEDADSVVATEDSDPIVAYKEDGSHNASVTVKDEISSSSSKLNEAKLSTKEPLQVQEQPQPIEKVNKGEVNVGQLFPVKINEPVTEAGIFKSMWRKWFKGDEGHREKICHTDNDLSNSGKRTNTVDDGKFVDSKDQMSEVGKVSPSSSLSSNAEVEDAEVGSKTAENVDKVSKPRGMFDKIVRWCKFWVSDENDGDSNAEFSKNSKEISSYSETQELFTESFWNDLLAFLETSKGSDSVSRSKTRQEMEQKLLQFGPFQLQSLSESHITHLVDLLITDKKWIVETPSQTFPFRLVAPSTTSSSNKPSTSKDSDSNSQGQNGKTGVYTLYMKNNVPPKNRSQIISDCQKLANEVVEQHPQGFQISNFKKLFLEKYGYNLEVQQLGYQKLASLLQIMQGIKLESNCIFSSRDRLKRSSLKNDNDTQWEELGPIADTKTKQYDDFEPVSDNDVSDSEEESSVARIQSQSQPKRTQQESSLLQILDSWYSNKDESNSCRIASDGSDESIDRSNDYKTYDLKQTPSRRYSFVEDKPKDDKEDLINGILGSLNKSGNRSAKTKMEG
ncbi:uncharacterized protein [Rutidosis leptorrhynchoides]|uniref:uncharacterized protein n=1 Tax=Rutidosis leptorrhynchoides TaxID=125765 RepID=UPI003A9A2910